MVTDSLVRKKFVHDALQKGIMKIYATQNKMNQITDFMKAIGIRYELI